MSPVLHLLLPQEEGPCFRSEPPQPHTSSPGLDPDQGPRESKVIILLLTDVFLTLTLTKFHLKTREDGDEMDAITQTRRAVHSGVLSEIGMLVARSARGVHRQAAAPTDPAEIIQPR